MMSDKKLARKIWFRQVAVEYFSWVMKLWYSLTMHLTMGEKTRVKEYLLTKHIAEALRYGEGWRSDGKIDTMTHPTRVQARLDDEKDGLEDCLPVTTLVLSKSRGLIEMKSLNVGDEIWDGNQWTRVLVYYAKGTLPVVEICLNNGAIVEATNNHRMLCVSKTKNGYSDRNGSILEKKVSELVVKDDLYQPDTETVFGDIHLDPDEAYLLGLYISEGWSSDHRVGFSGVENSKGHRERLVEICKRKGYKFYEQTRSVTISNKEVKSLVEGCGKYGPEKRLPHVNFDRQTTEIILDALDADSHVCKHGRKAGQVTFSTTSPILALQYRLLRRRLGQSVSIFRVVKHGGLGKNPIYRVYLRGENTKKHWARITNITNKEKVTEVCDITTESGVFYLPESDIVVHNCDGYAGYWCAALLKSGLATKVWFCTYQMLKTETNEFSGHALVVFKDRKGDLLWADYREPALVQGDDEWGWTFANARGYKAVPLAANMTEVTLGKHDTPKFGKTKTKTFDVAK